MSEEHKEKIMAEVVDNDEKIGVCENDFVISTPKVTMFSI